MISKFSVKKPYTVFVAVVLSIILGVVSFTRMTTDLLPSISLPYVIVMTTYPGASPETVEMAVTSPVESAMATVSNIENITSVSNENYSMVVLEFAQTADMNAVSLEIRESLDQIKSYWDDSIGNPVIMKLNPDMLPVMIAAVGVEGMDYAQISDYVQDNIVPGLESIEGVASVSASGLLEESVNVIIRSEKVEQINEKIFAAIDDKMQEAEQQLIDGRDELTEGKKELADGKKELLSSRNELNKGLEEIAKGKQELENGKAELDKQQQAISAQLAQQKNALLTAKTNLETMQTNLSTAKGLQDGMTAIDQQLAGLQSLSNCDTEYTDAVAALQAAMMGLAYTPDDPTLLQDLETAKLQIEQVKVKTTGNALVAQAMPAVLAATPLPPEMIAALDSVGDLDWTDAVNNGAVVGTYLNLVKGIVTNPAGPASVLETKKADLQTAMVAATNGLGYEGYVNMVNQALAAQNITDINKAIADINNGLIEIEKGQLQAAVQFANSKTDLAFGEYNLSLTEQQLKDGKTQVQSGLDQMKDVEAQLQDAEQQLLDGEEELAQAKEDAYAQADMGKTLTVDTIKSLLTAQNFSMPAGYVTEEGVDFLVRVGDKPESAEEMAAMPLMDLHMEGVPVITLGDVADVFYTDNSADIYTNVNGSPGVMLTIQKQTGYSTGEVSDLLEKKFRQLMEENEALSLIALMDQGIYIDLVMDSIFSNIFFGFGLAIIILILFLKDLRPTAVVAVSIPISLVTAIVCMYFSGVTLNVISLSGLSLGIGMLVDNSIVVIENIYRLRNKGMGVKEAAIEGAREVAGAIVASTLTTVCVFLPIVFTEGITRQLFVDMGLTIGYSLLASLMIALTVVPAMSSMILSKTKEKKEGRIFKAFVRAYEAVLKVSLKVKPLVLLLALGLLVGSAALAISRGTAFMPDMDSTQLTVNVKLDDEATLEDTRAVTDRVVEAILSIEEVENAGAMTSSSGMSMLGGGGESKNAASVYVVTAEDKDSSNEEIAKQIMNKTEGLDAEITVDTSSMDMSALGGSGISIQVQGRDLDELQRIASEVAAILEGVEGTAGVNDGQQEAEEELRVIINRDEAVHYGLTVAQVYSQIYSRLAEAGSATTLVAADKDYNVYVMSGDDIKLTRELVKELPITGTDSQGKKVELALQEIADFETAKSLTSINRASQTRYITVSAGIAEGYNVGLVSADVEKALKDYRMPAGYQLVFAGENEMIVDAMEQVMLMLVLAILFMYLIMVAQFQSLKSPFIILFTIPLAFTGGFLGLFISGSEVSVIALIGFVMLAGIIVNNGIVIIDYMNQLRESGMAKKEAILEAGRTRLRPVLMTALTTILALSTMVFSNNMGSEMAKPMAIVSIGGLVYGTLLTLIVIPCIYDIFHPEKKGKKEELQ